MEWLNYHHLHYFWVVVQEGSIAAAGRRLGIGRPSISAQLKRLEGFLGEPLFERRGRHLDLTSSGQLVYDYAEEIFRAGRELVDVVRGRPGGRPRRFRVAIADVMPKLVAFQLLLPVLDFDEEVALEVSEGHPEQLFAQLAVHQVDLVLSDTPLPPGLDVKAYSHLVGQSTTTLYAAPDLAGRLASGFPGSLTGAPFLMPTRNTVIRSSLEAWFEGHGVKPAIVGEFQDSALIKVFGQAGRGVFAAPTVVSAQTQAQYDVLALGELESVRDRYFAISTERRIRHPAVTRMVERAKDQLFS